jgi:hypothetical protein
MPLILDGNFQYAQFDGTVSVQGIVSYSPLGTLVGYPLWMVGDVRLSQLIVNSFLFGLFTRLSLQWNADHLDVNNGVAELANVNNALTLNTWKRVLVYLASRTSCTIWVDGDPGPTDVTDSPFPAGVDHFIVGALPGGDHSLPGSVANVAAGLAPLTVNQRQSLSTAGSNPLAYPGCVRNWPLKTDALDVFGAWPLTLVGGASVTAVGHPEVAVYPTPASAAIETHVRPDAGRHIA